MGKYKRNKRKIKKQKRFANVTMILNLIKENKDKLENLSTIQIERREINWGDGMNSENGYQYLLFFADKTAYQVGESHIIEDDEDWAQADGWTEQHCIDYLGERWTVPALEVLEKLENILNKK